MRIGNGYDVHKLVFGRELILGGIHIPCDKGLLGHSDADVLIHAIMDALLGSCGMGDIGNHFPDNDSEYKDISSMKLLEKVVQMLDDKGFSVGNIDSIIIAESPKLSPYIEKMRSNIAKTCRTEISRINVKATTEEGLGFTGTGQGISASTVCLIEENI